ncbi:hypothetical protein [Bradyrhizobium sp. 143]|uniref:hypothetical protein n=1 Tax=Bradyrhizobium sp. 143 TaxID=2782619 RepID=UPI001FFA0C4B|nr:hypothetical protein [Bradyrhizobium sp. 143]MCK1708303.1 hypothetical protein [Bradyrhizobium sp. 143]
MNAPVLEVFNLQKNFLVHRGLLRSRAEVPQLREVSPGHQVASIREKMSITASSLRWA